MKTVILVPCNGGIEWKVDEKLRKLEGVGIEFRFDSDRNPFDFLSEVQDLLKAKNFFETRVIEYQSSGALVDDF